MTQRPDPADLRALPAADRLELIEALWDSLAADAEAVPLPDWHRTEIDRRLDALNKGESVGAPWEEVRRRITGEP
jgi:putative addiction module component (TIGR02574 family)